MNNEQMYGIAEPPAVTVKREPSSQPSTAADQKREKLKKKQRTNKGAVGSEQSNQSLQDTTDTGIGKKKASIRPHSKHSHQMVSAESTSGTAHLPHPETDSQLKLPCGLQASSNCPPQHVSSSVAKKKIKKPRKKNNDHSEECLSEPMPIKIRPEALNISVPENTSTPSQNDGPDTGDVQHMLQELLNPPQLSLVTPIPTPNKLQPFTFPASATHVVSHSELIKPLISLCSFEQHHVFKAPSSSDGSHFGPPAHSTSSPAIQQQSPTISAHKKDKVCLTW